MYTVIYLDGEGRGAVRHTRFSAHFRQGGASSRHLEGTALPGRLHRRFESHFRFSPYAGGGGAWERIRAAPRGSEVHLHHPKRASAACGWAISAFSLANLEFTLDQETGPQSLLLRGFRADTATKASGDTLNCLVTLRTEQLKLDDTQYGPGVFELELRNLDAPTLARLQQELKEEQAQPRQESSEAAQMKTLSRYLSHPAGPAQEVA